MNKKIVFAALAVTAIFIISSLSFAAEVKKAPAPSTPSAQVPPKQIAKPAFNMVSGTILKIDSADPANVKLEVKNDADNTTHVISVSPMTQVTKATDISELKTGDAVRVMSRKADDKEIAMGIMFGKLPARPMPKPAAKAAAPQVIKK